MSRTTQLDKVCSDFVNRVTRSAKADNTSGSLHNKGETLVSYARKIASHDGNGNIVIHTSGRNSATTSKHISAVKRQAAYQGRQIVYED